MDTDGQGQDLRWRDHTQWTPNEILQLGTLFRTVGFQRDTDPALLTAAVAGSRWAVSAWDGDQLVAFARALSDGVSNAYVSTVAVAPTHQRRGVGRELLTRLLADKPGVKWVLHTSDAGEPLYRSLGFVTADRMLVRPRGSDPAR